MSTGYRSYGYSRAILLGSASLLALIAHSSANAQQAATTPSPSSSPTSAPAAQSSDQQLTEVVITGFRASLQTALDEKRKSELPIESVAPEDIGKMPDQDVAESLQRLPGVQIDRAPTGQGTSVLIDGLRQNLTTLNGDIFLTGKEFYVSGEASGGGAGSNAQYSSLEGIPSEELGGIDVYQEPEGLDHRRRPRRHDQSEDARPAGAGRWAVARRQLSANPMRSARTVDAEWRAGRHPTSSAIALAFTASVSYDDEKTLTRNSRTQNRNQWLITDSATGPYTGALTPAGLGVTPGGSIIAPATKNAKGCSAAAPCGVGGKYYIDPQLAYFTNVNDERKTNGAAFGVRRRSPMPSPRISISSTRARRTTTSRLLRQGMVQRSGHFPGLPAARHRSDPAPTRSTATAWCRTAPSMPTAPKPPRCISRTPTRPTTFSGSPNSMTVARCAAIFDASYSHATSNLQADQADVEHGLYTTSAGVRDFARRAGLQQRLLDLRPGHRQSRL